MKDKTIKFTEENFNDEAKKFEKKYGKKAKYVWEGEVIENE